MSSFFGDTSNRTPVNVETASNTVPLDSSTFDAVITFYWSQTSLETHTLAYWEFSEWMTTVVKPKWMQFQTAQRTQGAQMVAPMTMPDICPPREVDGMYAIAWSSIKCPQAYTNTRGPQHMLPQAAQTHPVVQATGQLGGQMQQVQYQQQPQQSYQQQPLRYQQQPLQIVQQQPSYPVQQQPLQQPVLQQQPPLPVQQQPLQQPVLPVQQQPLQQPVLQQQPPLPMQQQPLQQPVLQQQPPLPVQQPQLQNQVVYAQNLLPQQQPFYGASQMQAQPQPELGLSEDQVALIRSSTGPPNHQAYLNDLLVHAGKCPISYLSMQRDVAIAKRQYEYAGALAVYIEARISQNIRSFQSLHLVTGQQLGYQQQQRVILRQSLQEGGFVPPPEPVQNPQTSTQIRPHLAFEDGMASLTRQGGFSNPNSAADSPNQQTQHVAASAGAEETKSRATAVFTYSTPSNQNLVQLPLVPADQDRLPEEQNPDLSTGQRLWQTYGSLKDRVERARQDVESQQHLSAGYDRTWRSLYREINDFIEDTIDQPRLQQYATLGSRLLEKFHEIAKRVGEIGLFRTNDSLPYSKNVTDQNLQFLDKTVSDVVEESDEQEENVDDHMDSEEVDQNDQGDEQYVEQLLGGEDLDEQIELQRQAFARYNSNRASEQLVEMIRIADAAGDEQTQSSQNKAHQALGQGMPDQPRRRQDLSLPGRAAIERYLPSATTTKPVRTAKTQAQVRLTKGQTGATGKLSKTKRVLSKQTSKNRNAYANDPSGRDGRGGRGGGRGGRGGRGGGGKGGNSISV